MGNCLQTSSRVDSAADPSKNSVKSPLSSVPSTLTTHSTPSTLTVASHGERTPYDSRGMPQTEDEILQSPNLKAFTFNELKNATRNFRPESLIGEGGFGYVYKGWMDEQTFSATKPGSGMVVAVKRLKPEGFQGHKEWLTEVNYLGQLHHPNLVKLIGYCSEGDNRLLVYEFMPKGSLENHLFRNPSKNSVKSPLSSVPSTLTTHSTPSTLTVASHGERTPYDSRGMPQTEDEILQSPNLKAFTFNELKNATRNFRPESLIGEGGFGYVYKGWMDEQTFSATKPGSGMVVAVKRLKPEGFQGHKEWLTEVNYLGQLHHPNLVKLIGYCSEGDNRLLVYEFMPKGSLENHLFRRGIHPLTWAIRVKVAMGAAKGLSFLHNAESQVIYRDVKTSNILLDTDFNAKLSDFGLAKAGPTGDKTHVSTQVMGTEGYAAPEYIATGRLSAKSDVYSFGVVLLELLSGRRAIDKSKKGIEQSLVDWAKPNLDDQRKLFRVMDGKLEGQYPKKGAYAVAALALQCLKEAKLRPQMSEVLAELEQIQDPKCAAKQDHNELMNASSPLQKSPMRHNRSPHRPTPRGSPLPSHRRSPRVLQ